jgi:nitric oxide reductase NorQ protein
MKNLINKHARRGTRRRAKPGEGDAPFYLPQGNEVEVFQAAYAKRLPVMLKGPTGCGKTRFWNTWPTSWAARW